MLSIRPRTCILKYLHVKASPDQVVWNRRRGKTENSAPCNGHIWADDFHFVTWELVKFRFPKCYVLFGIADDELHWLQSCLTNQEDFSWSRNSQQFMEPEGSLPFAKQPTTCPYPEPTESSACPQLYFWKCILILFNIILPSTPRFSKRPVSLKRVDKAQKHSNIKHNTIPSGFWCVALCQLVSRQAQTFQMVVQPSSSGWSNHTGGLTLITKAQLPFETSVTIS